MARADEAEQVGVTEPSGAPDRAGSVGGAGPAGDAPPGDEQAAGDAAAGVRALGEAEAAYQRMDVEAVVAHLSAAVRAFTAAGEARPAAMACVRLGDALANGLGNVVAGRAWFRRATRLVADEPPCIEQGWVAVAAMGCDVGDPEALLASADLAVDRARRFGDVDLEAKALADGGLALVQAGRLADGMARLDEAMALVCGPAEDVDTACRSVCSFFTACYHAGDFGRAASWAGLLRSHGLLGPATTSTAFVNSHCDSVQATLLCELGRWSEAEALLQRAAREVESAMPLPAWHPAIVLADLRTRQGRLDEAEGLLLGKDQALDALLPAARLHLARGDADLARAVARRGLRALGPDRLRAAELLAVLVEAELAAGDIAAATAACDDLARRVGNLDVAPLRTCASLARARLLDAVGEAAAAIAVLEAALDGLDAERLPWRRATLLLELAARREAAGDAAGAALDATAAAAALATLDVTLPPDRAATLARLARPPAGPGTVDPATGPTADQRSDDATDRATDLATERDADKGAGRVAGRDAREGRGRPAGRATGPAAEQAAHGVAGRHRGTPRGGGRPARPTAERDADKAPGRAADRGTHGGAGRPAGPVVADPAVGWAADGVRTPVVGTPGAVLVAGGGWWEATCGGTTVRFRGTKGLAYLAELIACPGVERHALDLVDRVEGVDRDGPSRRALGDAGAALDPAARAAYRRRVEELRGTVEDLLVAGRDDEAAAAQAELDQLVGQLAQAFGLGGRSRPQASAAERARLNVTRSIRAATARLTEGLPTAGAALDRAVRTGLYCAYAPEPGESLRWAVRKSFGRD